MSEMGKEDVWSSSVRSRDGWRALEEAEGWTERRVSVRLETSTVLVLDFLSKRSRALALVTLVLEAVLMLLFSRCILLKERRFCSPPAFLSPVTWLVVLAVSTSDSGEMESVRAGKPEPEPWVVTPVLLLFWSSLFSSLSLASRNAMTASVSFRSVAVSMLPTESLRSRPLLPLLIRGMSSAGTLVLGFSIVKLPWRTRGFPDFSPSPGPVPAPAPPPPFLSSDLFLRSVLPDVRTGALDGEDVELCFRLLVISTSPVGVGDSPSPLFSFSGGSVSCFSPISDLSPRALVLDFTRGSSTGSWGSVLRLRSVRLEEDSPLLRDALDSKASASRERTNSLKWDSRQFWH